MHFLASTHYVDVMPRKVDIMRPEKETTTTTKIKWCECVNVRYCVHRTAAFNYKVHYFNNLCVAFDSDCFGLKLVMRHVFRMGKPELQLN